MSVVFCHALLPFVCVAWLADLGRDAVGVFVCHEASVLVLCLHVSVDIFHEKQLLESYPFVEYLLCIVNRESCKIFTYRGVCGCIPALCIVALDLLCDNAKMVNAELEKIYPEDTGIASVLYDAERYSLLAGGKRAVEKGRHGGGRRDSRLQ